MREDQPITPVFVEFMPPQLAPDTLYISLQYKTAIHLCACGCGIKTVTPLGYDGWLLTWADGKATLSPSIGNQQFPCKSHYWIRENKIVWA